MFSFQMGHSKQITVREYTYKITKVNIILDYTPDSYDVLFLHVLHLSLSLFLLSLNRPDLTFNLKQEL